MTRQHFVAIAATVKASLEIADNDEKAGRPEDARNAITRLANDLATQFAQANSRFDRARFLKACGVN